MREKGVGKKKSIVHNNIVRTAETLGRRLIMLTTTTMMMAAAATTTFVNDGYGNEEEMENKSKKKG